MINSPVSSLTHAYMPGGRLTPSRSPACPLRTPETRPSQIPCGAADLYCPAGSAAPTFAGAGVFTIGDFDGEYGPDAPPSGAGAGNASSNGLRRRPDDARGAAYRSGVAACPAGWYCTGDGLGSECPPGYFGGEVSWCGTRAICLAGGWNWC